MPWNPNCLLHQCILGCVSVEDVQGNYHNCGSHDSALDGDTCHDLLYHVYSNRNPKPTNNLNVSHCHLQSKLTEICFQASWCSVWGLHRFLSYGLSDTHGVYIRDMGMVRDPRVRAESDILGLSLSSTGWVLLHKRQVTGSDLMLLDHPMCALQ